MKRFLKRTIIMAFAAVMIFGIIAQSTNIANLTYVENIIAGKQDKLVFGTVVSISDRVCTVEVMEEIGEIDKRDENEIGSPSLVGKKIEVESFRTYMYYEDFDHSPKIGDNVLLSLSKSGSQYKIKNGAFRVNAASHDSFFFVVPNSIDSTASAMHLTALYRFVGSNGKNADYTIKDNVVYTHDTANNGALIKITTQEGLIFVNEKGETTKETDAGKASGMWNSDEISPYKWIIASAIILLGLCAGLFISRFFIKLEKKIDSK